VRADSSTAEKEATSRDRFLSPYHRPYGRLLPEEKRSAPRAILLPSVSSLSQCPGKPETWGAGAQDVTPRERSSTGGGTSETRAACHRHHLPWAMWRISTGECPQPCTDDPPQDRPSPRSPASPDRPLPDRCGPQGGEHWGTTRWQSRRAPCKKTGRILLANPQVPKIVLRICHH
jgi:hypothetical protein